MRWETQLILFRINLDSTPKLVGEIAAIQDYRIRLELVPLYHEKSIPLPPLVSFFVTHFASLCTNSTTCPDPSGLAFRFSNPKSYANPQGKKTLHGIYPEFSSGTTTNVPLVPTRPPSGGKIQPPKLLIHNALF